MTSRPGIDALRNANIELEHIQLELKYNRFHHLRAFVDQYYCYCKGHVTKSGKAKWSDILWSGNTSKLASKTRDPKAVVKEHVIPLNVITDKLKTLARDNKTSKFDIKNVLDKYIIFATITKEEDALLREAKLTSTMPDDWNGKDLWARYKKVGIKMI